MSLDELADVVGGRVEDASGHELVDAPPFADSRQPVTGGLFVAVVGERVDGHNFADDAVAAGAAAVLAGRPLGVPAVVVDDPVPAIGRLAAHVRAQLPDCTVVGITGSQGKTSTKDLLGQLLARVAPTVAAAGSMNTEIGVPLTILRADRTTRYLVLEMGARGRGHIDYLAGLARPDVALVLNVGVAHLGEFGSREAIAAAKGELVGWPGRDGHTVLNADDPLVAAMADRSSAPVTTFGTSPGSDVRLHDLRTEPDGTTRFGLDLAGTEVRVHLALVGAHQALNAAAAAAVAYVLGLSADEIAAGLAAARRVSRWRMEVDERPDGVLVLNDAYNANPDSMSAALRTLTEIAVNRAGSRSVAVLGEMLELGPASPVEHERVGRLVAQLDVSHLLVVGEGARGIHTAASAEPGWAGRSTFVPDVDAAIDALGERLRPGDVVLVKASRASGLECVAEAVLRG